jgi:hypothetical protein
VPVGEAGGLAREAVETLRRGRRATERTARRIDAEFRVGAAAAAYLDVYRRAVRP